MTYPPRWPKWNAHPSIPRPYPLVLDPDGVRTFKGDGFLGTVCAQEPGEWFWRGWVLTHGKWHHRFWPDLQVAAWDLHRLCQDARNLGPDWVPATWFEGHLPRSVRQSKGRPNISGSWRLSPHGNVLSLRLADVIPKRLAASMWEVFWNGQRVIANKGFEWFATESAQQAAEDFDLGYRTSYRLR